ncbi:MAG: ABC transporter ATP-binding protein, partial [Lentisphaerae bacterium]|nr:ABC transporter ATP-binding protein [Lentisphaerota bacterium]
MLDTLRRLNCLFTRRHRIALAILLVLMLIGAVLEVVGLGLLPAFVVAAAAPDRLLAHDLVGPVVRSLNMTTPKSLLMGGSLVLLVVFLAKSSYKCFLFYVMARFVWNRQVQLGHSLFVAYMGVPYEFLLQHNTAELKRNVFGETTMVATHVLRSVLAITMHGIVAVVIAAALFAVQPAAAAVGIAFLGLAGGTFLWVTRGKVTRSGLVRQSTRRAVIQAVEEAFALFKDARVLGRQSFFADRFLENAESFARAMRQKYIIGRFSEPILELIAVSGILGMAVILLLMGRDMVSVASILALFAAGLLRLRASVNSIAVSYNELRHYAPAVDVVYEHLRDLDACPIGKKSKQKGEESLAMPFSDRINLERVSYCYPSAVSEAIRDITITIPKGASVGLVGRTGSGKSTLVDVLLGLLTPQAGRLMVDGTDVCTNPAAWRRNLGYVPQAIRLIDDSIRNNIAFGLSPDEIDDREVDRAVRTAQLKEMVDALPEGLDTVVGEQGVRISGGERQRIAIARALYRNPDVLVLDEATSDLDNNTERALMKAIEESSEGQRTLIMIAHR